MAEQLSDETWAELDAPSDPADSLGFGMMLKMSRCHDLGLGQLFFPDEDIGVEADEDNSEESEYLQNDESGRV